MTSKLRVLSLNVHKFVTPLSRRVFFTDLKEYLDELDLDVVCLQEFKTSLCEDSQIEIHTLEEFADTVWPHYSYGKNAIYDGGHHGNAILSKYPINEEKNFDISNHRLERRGVLRVNISTGELDVDLFCTHFDLTEWGRRRQLAHLRSFFRDDHRPRIICGDFNDWNSKIFKEAHQMGLKEAFHTQFQKRAKTFPAQLPLLGLDCIFYQGLKCTTAAILDTPIWKSLSDHLPLLAEFEIQTQP